MEPLAKRLTPEERKQCVPLEGKETTYSQVYPERLAHAILKGVRRVVRHYDPTRFQEIPLTKRRSVARGEWDRAPTIKVHQEVYFVDAVKDLTMWRNVIEQVKETSEQAQSDR